jgi:hypothetical protein
MKNVLIFGLVCLIFISCGCEPSFFTLTNNENPYPANQPASVKVTTKDRIEGQYTEIGYVFANGGSVESSIANLKEKAAELGGTSVIRLQTTVIRSYLVIIFIPIASDRYYCQGIVVKQ